MGTIRKLLKFLGLINDEGVGRKDLFFVGSPKIYEVLCRA